MDPGEKVGPVPPVRIRHGPADPFPKVSLQTEKKGLSCFLFQAEDLENGPVPGFSEVVDIKRATDREKAFS